MVGCPAAELELHHLFWYQKLITASDLESCTWLPVEHCVLEHPTVLHGPALEVMSFLTFHPCINYSNGLVLYLSHYPHLLVDRVYSSLPLDWPCNLLWPMVVSQCNTESWKALAHWCSLALGHSHDRVNTTRLAYWRARGIWIRAKLLQWSAKAVLEQLTANQPPNIQAHPKTVA